MTAIGGTAGFSQPWESRSFAWELGLTESTLTGSLSIRRTGGGLSYAGHETHAQSLAAYQRPLDAYDENRAPFTELGLATPHFVSEGENPARGAAIDDSPALTRSLTTFHFEFSPGSESLMESLISLFDPGAAETQGPETFRGPTTYTFSASRDGAAVSTADWSLHVLAPYHAGGPYETTHAWDAAAGTLSVNNYTDTVAANFPDTLAYLTTGTSRFDSLTIEVEGLASELVGIGFASPLTPIPEPRGTYWLLALLGLLKRRRGR